MLALAGGCGRSSLIFIRRLGRLLDEHLKTAMPILMDEEILNELADQAVEAARLGRNGVRTTP